MAYETIIVETRGRAGLIRLNRPEALNALSPALIGELNAALDDFDGNDKIGAIVITGSEKAFAAGADIKEMVDLDFITAYKSDFIADWALIAERRKPLIAAVAGYALGGGCELAMMCDFILATENAKFGQPEITIGVMPASSASIMRPVRHIFIGKAKTMEMCLTGRMMDAEEAERAGLVSRIVPAGELVDEAVKVAQKIAGFSLPAVLMTKESVNRAYETTMAEGIRFERRLFQSLFATEDKIEGMTAFIEKREPQFKNR